jgi:hypothetical protein
MESEKKILSEQFPIKIGVRKVKKEKYNTPYERLEMWFYVIPLERIFFVNEKIQEDEEKIKEFSKRIRELLKLKGVKWGEVAMSYKEWLKGIYFPIPFEKKLDKIHPNRKKIGDELIERLLNILFRIPYVKDAIIERVYREINNNSIYTPLFKESEVRKFQMIDFDIGENVDSL